TTKMKPDRFTKGGCFLSSALSFAELNPRPHAGLVVIDERSNIAEKRAASLEQIEAFALVVVTASPPSPGIVTILGRGKQSLVDVIQEQVYHAKAEDVLPQCEIHYIDVPMRDEDVVMYRQAVSTYCNLRHMSVSAGSLPSKMDMMNTTLNTLLTSDP